MEKAFRDIADLVCGNTAFVVTTLVVVAWTLAFTALFGPSREVALGMLGLGVTTAVIEFRNRPS